MGSYKCKYDEAKAILRDANVWDDAATIPRYRRPSILSAKQNIIIDAAQNPKVRVIFIEGPRRTGKSTAGFIIIYEEGLNGNKKWGVWGATEDSASKILRDITQDPNFPDLTCHVSNATAQRVTCDNGVIIEAHASKVSDAKGLQYGGVWITEFDQLLRTQPLVFGAILAILRSEPRMKIILDANSDTGAYKMFKETFLSMPENVQEQVRFFTLLREDVTHIPEDADDLLKPLMEAAMGKDKVAEQLYNTESFEGECFNVRGVVEAFNGYDEWMMDAGFFDPTKARTRKVPERVVIAIDPGHSHATGIFIAGISGGHVFELESYEFVGKRLGAKASQQPVTEDYLKDFVAGKAHEYLADVVCETNSGGAWWMDHWRRSAGTKGVHASDFGKKGTKNDRNGFIHVLSMLINEARFHFCNDQLRAQLTSYNPDDRDKTEWKNKGDLADACLHAVQFLISKEKRLKQTVWDGR